MPKPEPQATTPPHPSALVAAVARVLRPLVALLMENGLTFQWLSGLLKSVFVDVADKEFRLPDKRQTDSRITLLTGVHRKDVRRLRTGSDSGDEEPPASVYLGAHLVAIWTSDNRYLDREGHPKALPRLPRGDEPSFEGLVTGVSKDIRPRAVLDEWLRLGAVDVDENDCVRLKTEAFVPSRGVEEKAYYLGRNVHDHIAAARHNVQGREPPMLERSVYYENLTLESVRELQELARQEGSRALQVINRRARELQAGDERSGAAGKKRARGGKATGPGGRRADSGTSQNRINFGVYFYHERENPDSGEAD